MQDLVLELVYEHAVLAATRLRLRQSRHAVACLPRAGALRCFAHLHLARRALRAWHAVRRPRRVHSWVRRRVRTDDTPVFPWHM